MIDMIDMIILIYLYLYMMYEQEKNEHTSFVHSLDRVYAVGVGKEVRESIFEGMEHLMLATILGINTDAASLFIHAFIMSHES